MSALAREILEYLECNPGGCDTLVGITKWWLLKKRVRTETNDVQNALDELVRLELVLQKIEPYGPVS